MFSIQTEIDWVSRQHTEGVAVLIKIRTINLLLWFSLFTCCHSTFNLLSLSSSSASFVKLWSATVAIACTLFHLNSIQFTLIVIWLLLALFDKWIAIVFNCICFVELPSHLLLSLFLLKLCSFLFCFSSKRENCFNVNFSLAAGGRVVIFNWILFRIKFKFVNFNQISIAFLNFNSEFFSFSLFLFFWSFPFGFFRAHNPKSCADLDFLIKIANLTFNPFALSLCRLVSRLFFIRCCNQKSPYALFTLSKSWESLMIISSLCTPSPWTDKPANVRPKHDKALKSCRQIEFALLSPF